MGKDTKEMLKTILLNQEAIMKHFQLKPETKKETTEEKKPADKKKTRKIPGPKSSKK